MYTNEDLNIAIEKGVFSSESVQQFQELILAQNNTVHVDEENFRLLSGFNDIFVVIASSLLLFSGAWFASTFHIFFGAAALSLISWGLAEFFVLKRKMALPAIILLISFLAGIASMPITLMIESMPAGGTILISVVLTALFAWLHWRRFRVPITVAAAAAAIITIILTLGLKAFPSLVEWLLPLLFVSGISLFFIAMIWDASDKVRQTRNSDVAFWLHLAAAPLIVHPIFSFLGILTEQESLWSIGLVIILYVFLTMISLAVDRRAIMVSSLGYVLFAFSTLFQTYGFVSYSFALTGIFIGASLLLLSAFWHTSRSKVLKFIPSSIKVHLPALS